LSTNELAKVTGKAMKTMFNQLAWMVNDGIVERVERGEYRLTSRGIKKTEEVIRQLKT
jgi:predicted transcriptional regulator